MKIWPHKTRVYGLFGYVTPKPIGYNNIELTIQKNKYVSKFDILRTHISLEISKKKTKN